MPLSFNAPEPIDPLKVPQFVIFYASIVDGKMWCPDCREVEGLVRDTFSITGPEGLIVYVGTRSEWRNPENTYRKDWKINNVPTIVKMQDGEELARLDDHIKIKEEIVSFVENHDYNPFLQVCSM